MEDIEKILNFFVEIEKIKAIYRKTKPVGLNRFENSAEHSWHVCLSALMLKDYANEPISINRVIKMLLIHDLGEIDAGDIIVYANQTPEVKEKEIAGIERIFSILPAEISNELIELWREFERGDSADSCFARAIDRVPPLLHNVYGGGHSWRSHGISKEQVYSLNSRIAFGSETLWSAMIKKLDAAVSEGILK